MKQRSTKATCAALVGLSLTGAVRHCGHARTSHGRASAAAPEVPVLHALRATDESIALNNLNGSIALFAQNAQRGVPDSLPRLIDGLLTRSQFTGDTEDLERALVESAALTRASDDAAAHLTRATALSSVHDFAAALDELDLAQARGGAGDAVAAERGSVLIALGREDEADRLLPPAGARTSSSPLVMRGVLAELLGHDAESEQLFEAARTRYRDVSPFMIAWMDFERARAAERSDHRGRARAYLAEAVSVLPGYSHAVVHLAAFESADRALALVTPLVHRTDDPDILGAYADALRRAGRPAEAAVAAEQARGRYEEVVARLPLAFADHAAIFYLGMGANPARALDLARLNAKNRPTDEALELWLTAAEASASRDDQCASARALLGRPHLRSTLRERATTAARRCP